MAALSVRSRLKALTAPDEDGLSTGPWTGGSPSDLEALENARRERRRMKITKEIFETEKTYLHHLSLVHKFFEFPLRFACIIPEDANTRLFSNVEQLQEVNHRLLELMEQSTVGEAFRHLGPFLKLYSTYANNHQLALSTLQEWKQKSPDFARYIAAQEERPEMGGLKLNALLITPVQRIPRYKMLLTELLKYTPEDHHDFLPLQEATTQISAIAEHINEHIRQHENFQKMLSIQNSFDNSAPRILAPGRQFLKEGPLKKVSRKGAKSHERMFFLFNDMLIYGKPKFLDSGSRTYSCCCVLPLKHCSIDKLFITNFKKPDGGGMFRITCKEEQLVLYSDDQVEVQEWSGAIETAVRKLRNDRQTLRKPSSNMSPLRGKSLRLRRRQDKKEEPKIRPPRPPPPVEGGCLDCSPLQERHSPQPSFLQHVDEMDLSISAPSPDPPPFIRSRPSPIMVINRISTVSENSENSDFNTSCGAEGVQMQLDDSSSQKSTGDEEAAEREGKEEDCFASAWSIPAMQEASVEQQVSPPGRRPRPYWQHPSYERPPSQPHSPSLPHRLREYLHAPIERVRQVKRNFKNSCSPFKKKRQGQTSSSQQSRRQ